MKHLLKWLRSIKPRPTRIAPPVPSGFDAYEVTPISLGLEGKLRAANLELRFSCSTRDGIFVQLKSTSPWRVLFEYADGGYLINDDTRSYSEWLTALNQLRESAQKLDYTETDQQLEHIVQRHFGCLFEFPVIQQRGDQHDEA